MTDIVIDQYARPSWKRTGYRYFPYAAERSGVWWVLRLNPGFPEHDAYTLFVGGRVAGDLTGSPDTDIPLLASVDALRRAVLPVVDPDTARVVVGEVAQFVEYGSESGDPCPFCSTGRDGMTRQN
ncbi:hypothetical protein [Mycolicibacterium porcinum]|uniref:Uncharacterized protein n=1 Tax=Mycolicibacterium porcinum TaxID=39693 RepID=A0ABV3VKB8_9MYCO